MDLSTLSCGADKRKSRKRVGRGPGSGWGKTSGRGHKGQKSRSGYARRTGFEGGQMPLNRRLPKRGFKHFSRHPFVVVNLDVLEQHFQPGAKVTPEALVEAGLIELPKGGVKILGRGELTKSLSVTAQAITPGARQKIEAAGGSVELIEAPKKGAEKASAEE